MRPFVSFLNAALHGVFRRKLYVENGKADTGGTPDAGPGAGSTLSPGKEGAQEPEEDLAQEDGEVKDPR